LAHRRRATPGQQGTPAVNEPKAGQPCTARSRSARTWWALALWSERQAAALLPAMALAAGHRRGVPRGLAGQRRVGSRGPAGAGQQIPGMLPRSGPFTPTQRSMVAAPRSEEGFRSGHRSRIGGRTTRGTQAVAEADVDSSGRNLQRNSADSVACCRCPARLLAPTARNSAETAAGTAVTAPLPSLRSEGGSGGSGLGRPAQPGPPAAARPADHRPRSSGARWPPRAR
jgi:hypothetical protein